MPAPRPSRRRWLNAAYRDRFGFPFIICVARHTAANVLRQIQLRLQHEPAPALAAALDEVGHITRLRLSRRIEAASLPSGPWLAHGIHFDTSEIGRLAASGVAVTHCPCSNQVLASDTCPVCALERAGVAVGLGVDGSASNDGSNLMQEVRAAFLLQRGANGIDAVSHRDALRWATEGSVACLGRPELG